MIFERAVDLTVHPCSVEGEFSAVPSLSLSISLSLSALVAIQLMPPCPFCSESVPDVISHHLTRHPDESVPADLVRDLILTNGTRCFACYVPVEDRLIHYENVHIRAVQTAFESINEPPIWRGQDGLFTCSWCQRGFQNPTRFLVSVGPRDRKMTNFLIRIITTVVFTQPRSSVMRFNHTRIRLEVEA